MMCAIAGMLGLRADAAVIGRLKATMLRRGPDDFGVFSGGALTLLHARLAVIDLAGGRQPMSLTVGQECYTLVYNGELYNTRELRQELEALGHRFSGHSDTEVVLHGYAQWGLECLTRFNGIFAFAVWEQKARRLVLARDRMGVKPLFYAEHQGGFLFASELKTILAYPGFQAAIDAQGAGELLLLGPGRTPGSGVFRGIRELEPGCYGIYEAGSFRWKRYWKLTDGVHDHSLEETLEAVRYLVTDAIRRQMVSDVPLGTFLSGGLDSSIISAVCARELGSQGKRLPTFSVDYEHNREFFRPGKFQPTSDADFVGIMEQAIGSRPHRVTLTAQELADALEDATRARDLPGMADVDFSLLLLCREIRKEVTVALSGECADEVFGGYPWYRDPEVRQQDGFPWAQSTALRQSLMTGSLQSKLDAQEFVHSRYRQTLAESDISPEASPLERRMKEMVNLNFRWFMQTLLDRKDRMSMDCSLEVRVPFCDWRIAQYLYRVPWEMKDLGGVEKGLLRKAMEGLLPEAVLWRKKSPYPKTYDPTYLSLMTHRMEALLQTPKAPLWSLVQPCQVRRLMEQEFKWPWYGQLMAKPQTLAYLICLNVWLELYNVDIFL